MNIRFLTALVAVWGAMFAAPASAVVNTVTFTGVTGTWSNAVLSSAGPPYATYAGNGSASATVRWGTAAGSAGRSGYNYNSVVIAPITVPASGMSADFTLADFAYVNEPTYAPSITSIDLTVSADVHVNTVDLGIKNFAFNFLHDETPNGLNPCPYGGANNQGVNVNGCADREAVNYSHASDTFTIGAQDYTLNIIGFVLPGSPTPVGEFLTKENAVDNAQLIGQIVLPGSVPEPATWAMMICGFGLVGASLRGRTATIQRA